MNRVWVCAALTALLLAAPHPTSAAVITFDTAVTGATSFGFDGDGDGIEDVIFSTSDPFGFNTIGPGVNMSFIDEPGLEGTTELSPDLVVDFLVGATGQISFGFAVSAVVDMVPDALTFSLFDVGDNLLASIAADAARTATPAGLSSFPEAFVTLPFAGTAAYGQFDFDDALAGRYILDNFAGDFGTTQVPEPSLLALLGVGLLQLTRRVAPVASSVRPRDHRATRAARSPRRSRSARPSRPRST